MEILKLSEIALPCEGEINRDVEITNVCIDSRNVTKGCLFIAIAGANFDGHDFVKKAVEAGAAAIMCHKPIECDIPTVLVRSTVSSLIKLAAFYRMKFNIPVVGLTGSVGKTTTKEMVWYVLSEKYKTLKNIGNRNNEIGMPLTVLELDREYQAAVFEMGMYFLGEISDLTRVARPSVGIITNIGVSHIENLGSQENILKAKLEIIDGMVPGSPLLLNGDDKYLCSAIIDGFDVDYYGIENENARFRANNIVASEFSTSFSIEFDGKTQQINLPAIGKHHVYDALAAFACGIVLGVTPQDAANGLAKYEPSGMRQKVVDINGITVIEDCYNASPDSMKAALGVLQSLLVKRRIAVLGDMNELGSISVDAHCQIGELAAQVSDIILAYGEKARGYVEGNSFDGIQTKHFGNKDELINEIYAIAKPGDGILFKASRGMKLEEVIEGLYERWNG